MSMRNSLGKHSVNSFIENYDDFILNINPNIPSPCIKQGIKALSIMYLSLDNESQEKVDSFFLKAIEKQIEIEKAKNELSYNTDDIQVRKDIEINSAISHESI